MRDDGYEVLGGIQNKSGHGIDLVSRRPTKGGGYEYRVTEVKVNGSQLSDAQALGGAWFTRNRLKRSEGWSLSSRAETAQEALKNAYKSGAQIGYDVARVRISPGKKSKIEFSPWVKE